MEVRVCYCLMLSIYPAAWRRRPGWPAGRQCWAQGTAAWTAGGDTPPLVPSPTRPPSVCPSPSPSPRPGRLLSGRGRRTRWPSPCWWGPTSRPSGPGGRTAWGWRTRSGTEAGAGTAAPGWLWGLRGRHTEKKHYNVETQLCWSMGHWLIDSPKGKKPEALTSVSPAYFYYDHFISPSFI